MRHTVLIPLGLLSWLLTPAVSTAQPSCEFAVSGTTMLLTGTCTTTASIDVPDGMTLDGNHHTIIALDPPDGPFLGPIVVARGGVAAVVNTAISTVLLREGCYHGAERLRGISFEDASGIIRGNTVDNVRRQRSGCEEGIGIEVRNSQNDVPLTYVEVVANAVDRYQKSGIVVHGGVDAMIRENAIGASAAQALLPANAIQVGPGARATVEGNAVLGNSFPSSLAAGTAILLMSSAPGTVVRSNSIAGDSDVGIYVWADDAIVSDNVLQDEGADGHWDIGLVNRGAGHTFVDHVAEGYRLPDAGIDAPPAGSRQQVE
jgi:hypothetical protein